MKFLFLGNGANSNRGCEAIIRGTVKLFAELFDSFEIANCSFISGADALRVQKERESDSRISNYSLSDLYEPPIPRARFSGPWWKLQFSKLGLPTDKSGSPYRRLRTVFQEKPAAAFQIGGDNYTMDYGWPARFMEVDNEILDWGVPLILWGASVGPFPKENGYEERMRQHLSRFSGIFVREDRSLNYLASIGIKKNVFRMDDPAFLMNPVKPSDFNLSFIDNSRKVLGINFSPLYHRYISHGMYELWAKECVEILKALLKRFDFNIILVPHVTAFLGEHMVDPRLNIADDLFLQAILERLPDMAFERVACLGNHYTAKELKWIIGQLDYFMGARTHSTIAAFSMNVPTISLAYSEKARGLNEYLFGTIDYSIDPNDVNPLTVCDALNRLVETKGNLRETLSIAGEKRKEAFQRTVFDLKSLTQAC